MDEHYWSAVRSVRLGIADLLDSLRPEDWDAPSLCRGWRVRDVAGHLALVPTITTWQLLAVAPRAGFNPNRANTVLARRHGSEPVEQIVTKLRRHADARRTARILDTRDSLFDAVVHSQDIAIPLGRDHHIPADHSRAGLQRVWSMGWPFNARRKLGRFTLMATDAEWSAGSGPEITGTALSLLLLLTGRTSTALDRLDGPGVAELTTIARG